MVIWITGPPGVGKTTIGRLLARKTDRTFVDLDEMIERSTGRSVAAIFEEGGEEAFRREETLSLASIVEHPEHRRRTVVATGGGSVLSHYNRDLMRSSGPRVLLEAPSDVLVGRLRGRGNRPLLGASPTLEQIEQLREQRAIPYDDNDLAINAIGEPESIVRVIRARLRNLNRPAWRHSEEVGKEIGRISIFSSPWGGVRRALRKARPGRVCVLTDENVAVYYGQTARRLAGSEGVVYVVEPGEGSKSFTVAERIITRLAQEGFSREDTIVTLGGGVITDLGGFIGSIYMRGVRTIAMPTSLLAMVDASVGGKTAINSAGLRNLVGTFRQPDEVIIVPAFLRSLPEREYRSGLVESMKMGFTGAEPLRSVAGAIAGSRDDIADEAETELIRLSVEEKLGVVSRDIEDRKGRRILNFGHTVAHALESVRPGAWTHGEAVAFGIIAETEVALRGHVAPVDSVRGEEIINDILPLTIPHPVEFPEISEMIDRMAGDKKTGPRGVVMVVPSGEKEWLLDRIAEPPEIEVALISAWQRVAQFHAEN